MLGRTLRKVMRGMKRWATSELLAFFRSFRQWRGSEARAAPQKLERLNLEKPRAIEAQLINILIHMAIINT